MSLFKDIKELLHGMKITSRHLTEHAITIQYPEETWVMPERSRGIVVLLSDKETGELNCTACMLCMRACPTGAIVINAPRDENKKRHLESFVVDNGLCCFCGLCEEACNFSALKMASKYEFSTENKEDLIWDVKKLQEIGLDVDYIDRRKKRPVKKAAPAKNTVVTEQESATLVNKATESADKPAKTEESEESTVSKSEPAGKNEETEG